MQFKVFSTGFEELSDLVSNVETLLDPTGLLGISLSPTVPESSCEEFLLQNDGESLFGEGRYTIMKDPAVNCTKYKKVNSKLTYLNVDTGQYLYWIDYGIQKPNGSWVV